MIIDKELFRGIVNDGSIHIDEPMCRHTSYKIGGPCDMMIVPDEVSQIAKIIEVCNKNGIPFYVLGNGSNVLIKDGGIRGVVIQISKKLSKVEIKGNTLFAEAGVLLSSLVKVAYDNSLGGLEFASGIPGSFGGAITMNAGAYGGFMAQIVKKVNVIDRNGNMFSLTGDELEFGYRQSAIRKRDLIVLSGEVELVARSKEEIKTQMDILSAKRKAAQPLSLPSCGSVFKRPEGHFIGKLIEEAGLKGTRSGGAEVSRLHANFIVNIDSATARDVLNLIEIIKEKVLEKFGIPIETEVIILGED